MWIVLGQAHNKAEVDLWVRVEFACAELDDVAHAFRGSMLALDAVVGRWTVVPDALVSGYSAPLDQGKNVRSNIIKLKVNLVIHPLHRRKDQLPQSILIGVLVTAEPTRDKLVVYAPLHLL